MTKDKQFHIELKALLKKFDAELMIEEHFAQPWGGIVTEMVVDFNWKPDLESSATNTLALGGWVDGDELKD